MKAFTSKMSSDQIKILKMKVADEINVQMRDYLIQYDAMWLWSAARTFGFGKKRLERMYCEFYDQRKADKEFFECNGHEGLLESEAVRGLRNMGIDIVELAKAHSDPVIETKVTK